MKSSREKFEEWVNEETGFDLHRTNFPMTTWDNQQYKDHSTNLAWCAWQASRAAIEIELPDKVMVEDDFDNGHNCAIDYCADAISDAGLTVKGDA